MVKSDAVPWSDRSLFGNSGGGNAFMSHPSIAAGVGHFFNDIMAKCLCCRDQPEELCQKYRDCHPSDPGTNYTAPGPSTGNGDPHWTTFDRLYYTFNGAGEFWLLKNSSVQPLALQTRMEIFGSITLLTAFAMQERGSAHVQVSQTRRHLSSNVHRFNYEGRTIFVWNCWSMDWALT